MTNEICQKAESVKLFKEEDDVGTHRVSSLLVSPRNIREVNVSLELTVPLRHEICDKSAGTKLCDTCVVIFKLMTLYNKTNGFMIAVSWDNAGLRRRSPNTRDVNAVLACVSRD